MSCLPLVALSVRAPAAMRVCAYFAAICAVSSVSVQRKDPDIQSTILEELPPLFIPCNLTDIVTISAPVQYNNDTLYYLYNPNNDVTKLYITGPITQTDEGNAVTDNERTQLHNSSLLGNQSNAYSVRNVNYRQKIDSKTKDVFVENGNQFAIGPVGYEDHGNWVLSAFFRKNGSWVEEFQVITIQITEYVPVRSSFPSLQVGGVMELGFAYALPDIETCELIVPAAEKQFGSYFREYSRLSLPTCTYVVPNLTIQDAGRWKIIGVGKIVYEGRVFVKLNNTGSANDSLTSTSTMPYWYAMVGSSSSERIQFLKLSMLPMLGYILKLYY